MKKILLIMALSFLIINYPKTVMAREHPYFILGIDVSQNGEYAAVTRIDHKLTLFDLVKKDIIKVFENKNNFTSVIGFTADSKYFVFQNPNHDLLFYDIEKGEITKKIPIEAGIYSIAFFKDGKRFIWGGYSGKIEFVNIDTNERIQLKPMPPKEAGIAWERPILFIKISPDEKYFLTTTYTNGYIGQQYPEPDEDMKLIEKGHLYHGNPTPDRYEFRNLGLNLWDATSLKKIKKLTAYFLDGRTWPSFSPDEKYVVAGSENGGAIFSIDQEKTITDTQYLSTNGFGFVSNESFLMMAASDSMAFLDKMNNFLNGQEKNSKKINLKHHPCTGALVTLPDKNLIIIGTRDGSISVYRYLPDKNNIELEWHPKPIASGIIRWISPLTTSYMKPTEIEELEKQYEEEQRKIIEQEKKSGTVETKYNQLAVPSK